jgi:hypothetical protein
MKVSKGISVFLFNCRVLLNEEGVIYIKELRDKVQENRMVEVPEIMMKLFIEGEIGQEFEVLFYS